MDEVVPQSAEERAAVSSELRQQTKAAILAGGPLERRIARPVLVQLHCPL